MRTPKLFPRGMAADGAAGANGLEWMLAREPGLDRMPKR